jgi:hypothetical protein
MPLFAKLQFLLWNVTATEERLLKHWSFLLSVAITLSSARRIGYEDAVREFEARAGKPSKDKPPGVLDARGWTPLIDQIKLRMQYPKGLEDMLRDPLRPPR